jgi:hypothetical protein
MPTQKTRCFSKPTPFIAIRAGTGMALSCGPTWLPEPVGTMDILQESGCTPFGEAARVSGTPVWWTYRVCPEVAADYRVDLRFENGSSTPLAFRYAAWTSNPGRCSDAMTPRPVDAGTRVLGATGSEDGELSSSRIPRAAFEGRIWLCVSDVEGLSTVQKLVYSVPCGPIQALPFCRRAE